MAAPLVVPPRRSSQSAHLRVQRPPPWVEREETHDLVDIIRLDEDDPELLPDCRSLDQQTELTDNMRQRVVAWLIDIRNDMHYHDASLHLAVLLADRTISKIKVLARNYQLVAIACLWIAVKFEEEAHKVPKLGHLCQLAMNDLDGDSILFVEREILHALNFNISVRTGHWFLAVGGLKLLSRWAPKYAEALDGRRILKRALRLAFAHLEKSLHYSDFLGVKPSLMAEATLATSCQTLKLPYSDNNLSCDEVKEVADLLLRLISARSATEVAFSTPTRLERPPVRIPLTPITPSNTEGSTHHNSLVTYSTTVVCNWLPTPPSTGPFRRNDSTDDYPDDPMMLSSQGFNDSTDATRQPRGSRADRDAGWAKADPRSRSRSPTASQGSQHGRVDDLRLISKSFLTRSPPLADVL
ncbi:cyclin-like protein [Gonapodya prolifera JEL478]|uniref:Cyclin-like protein n=1 Tax=Gonapodya prolifera (strain JEL478) TaxID=1344416 RepID=A0A139ADH5_GONPJ|nr:cyclin-like protein [Gonapodya prolifera JEL478]|eukprot:KXS14495.1 cyclin-like protein [Gonapodya prolifera JEL478]